jgi:hypothetical protein
MDWNAFWKQFALTLVSIPALAAFVWCVGKAIVDRWFAARADAYKAELDKLTKRDEILFSKLHERRAEIIAELYNKLVETHDSVHSCYDCFQDDPMATEIKEAKEAVRRCDDLAEFILRNKIYFNDVLAEELLELETCLGHAASYYEMFCEEPDKQSKVKEFEGMLGEVKVDIEGSMRTTELEFRKLLGVEN